VTRLLRSVHWGMIALLDRRLSSTALLAAIEGTDADLLAGLPAGRKRPILQHPGRWLVLVVLRGACPMT